MTFLGKVGYGGVDVFLFLSGIGIYLSLNKDFNIKSFYKKRILRILPAYMPMFFLFSVIYFTLGEFTVFDILTNTLAIGLWFNRYLDWYIPTLLCFYLFSPFLLKYAGRRLGIVIIVLICMSLIISYLITDTSLSYLLIFTIRIPTYLIGIWVGYGIKNKKSLKWSGVGIQLFLFFAGFAALHTLIGSHSMLELMWSGLCWYPFVIITFPLCMILATVLNFFEKYKYPVLTFIGSYSLGIFIFHQRIFDLGKMFWPVGIPVNHVLFNVIVVLLSLVLAYLWQNAIDKISNKLFSSFKV